MTFATETNACLESHLIDLTQVPLDALREISGLEGAIATLCGRLADHATPLCESGMAALCGTVPVTAPSTPITALDQT
ncbi:hypothetical protein [Nonomuraea sp. NPDC049684]|uniref:hypothetical protein n=1 Tax=Nonomuraea sp. NPDC049684 TaxID=3364356 RepID=UPI00378C8934